VLPNHFCTHTHTHTPTTQYQIFKIATAMILWGAMIRTDYTESERHTCLLTNEFVCNTFAKYTFHGKSILTIYLIYMQFEAALLRINVTEMVCVMQIGLPK
jgi:hypothetical protein